MQPGDNTGVPLDASRVPDLNLGARKFEKDSWPQRGLQEPNERWKLAQTQVTQDEWSNFLNGGIYCSAATMLTTPGPFCNMKVATYLLAARFDGTMLKGSDPVEGQDASYKATYSTDTNMPWMVADYVLTQTVQQKGVGISKKLYGEAQVDVFLCSDPQCTVMVDMVTVVPSNISNKAWCSGPPLSCMDKDEHAFQATPRRAVKFSHLNLDNTTAVSMATIRHYPMESYIRTVGKPASGESAKMRYEVVWIDDSPKWGYDDKEGESNAKPVVMPVGVLVRLAMSREFETMSFAVDEVDYRAIGTDGFSVLHYGVFRVHDLLANTAYCAAIVLPRNKWMDEHGWNVSDASCSSAEVQATFLFDSYFMQAKYFDERVVLAGSVDSWHLLEALMTNDTSYHVYSRSFIPDMHAVVNDTTIGLLFKPELAIEVVEGPLHLNKTALLEFGLRLGISWQFNVNYDPNTNAPRHVDFEPIITYVDTNCSWSTCRLLSVGSAIVLAWLAEFDGRGWDADSKEIHLYYQGLLHLKYASLDEPDPLLQTPWCLANEIDFFHGAVRHGLMAMCKQIGGGKPNVTAVSCSFDVYNCTRWDELGLGFAHGPGTQHLRHTGPHQGPSTHPLRDLLGNIWWKAIDKHVDDSPFKHSAYGYLEAVEVENALEDVCDGASSLLNRELNDAMVATDSTKSMVGKS